MLSYHLECILYSFKVFVLRHRFFFLFFFKSVTLLPTEKRKNIRELSNYGILKLLHIQRPVLLHPFSFTVIDPHACVYISNFL